MIVSKPLLTLIREQFQLDWNGVHGAAHWARVRHHGFQLARTTGADIQVIEYFAFLHDSCRESDGRDPEHGPRAARFACRIRTRHIHLDDGELSLLIAAIEGHTFLNDHGDVTVRTCWDADRLDLARVGIDPDPARLCTTAARDRDTIARASENARHWLRRYCNSQDAW